ncbi:hypothetical protein ACSHWG_07165 [Leucobacter sp. Z1108]|uniref:hypothetical protein n=1 Tax=Leucobacter sp. Z1108 TaxID=3439066 RepID=UPI003F33873B
MFEHEKHAIERTPIGPVLVLIGLLIPIAAGRWGSYIGIHSLNLFLPDALIALGLMGMLLHGRGSVDAGRRLPPSIKWVSSVLFFFVIFRLIATEFSEVSTAARDLAPLVYISLIPLLYFSLRQVKRRTVLQLLTVACVLHLVWFAPSVMGLLQPIAVNGPFGLPIFTRRNDFDLVLVGASVAVYLANRSLPGFLRKTLIAGSVIVLFAGSSRAGLFAGATALFIALILRERPKSKQKRVGGLVIALITLAAAAPAIAWLLQSPPSWMVGITRLVSSGSAEQISATNTWNARTMAWSKMAEYVSSSDQLWWFGTGPGGEPVWNSGAVAHLSGDESVRAAHSFIFTWLGFYGYLGVGIIVIALIILIAHAICQSTRIRGLNAVGLALTIGTIIAGLGGVIMESPFGYMSFVLGVTLSLLPADSTSYRPSPSIAFETRTTSAPQTSLESAKRSLLIGSRSPSALHTDRSA